VNAQRCLSRMFLGRPLQQCGHLPLCRELFPFLVAAIRGIAQTIHSRPQDVVFLPNVTTAINTVLQQTQLAPGSEVLMLDIGYGSSKTICRNRCDATNAKFVLATVPLPLKDGYALLSCDIFCMALLVCCFLFGLSAPACSIPHCKVVDMLFESACPREMRGELEQHVYPMLSLHHVLVIQQLQELERYF
jgi:hypothetical protein